MHRVMPAKRQRLDSAPVDDDRDPRVRIKCEYGPAGPESGLAPRPAPPRQPALVRTRLRADLRAWARAYMLVGATGTGGIYL